MGLITPDLPDLDLREWRSRPHQQRIKPLAQHWVEHGFGTPYAIHLFYLVKVALYAVGGLAVIAATPGIGSLGDVGSWWSELLVYQKIVIWTLLWEVLGVGSGSGPLTLRFLPPVGGFLHWLRPGTVRLPPWRLPLTGGTRRTWFDVALYVAVILAAVWLLVSPGDPDLVPPGGAVGVLDPVRLIPLAVALALLGFRDKTIFLAARGEHYWVMVLVFAFGYVDMVVGLKLVMVALWWGAATSKLNRHFPFVVAIMLSNSPLQRVKWFKRKLYRDYPEDLRPSGLAAFAAHTGTVIEFTLPAVLLFSHDGPVTTIALIGMVIFHTHIFSTFPMGVPLEWNVFFVYSALVLFGRYPEVGVTDLGSPVLALLLIGCLVVIPVLGNVNPRLVSFLPAMRYYAGNWATSLWCFREGTEHRLDEHIRKASALPHDQLSKIYGPELAYLFLYKGLAWRFLHTHGRALNGLLPRAVDDIESYSVREGELIAGIVLGWNFGDGHLHDEHLLAAVQERCGFGPGELRVIILESQPIQRQRQRYRIVDAATGPIEQGYVKVADMASRQPWLDADGTIPVHEVRRPAPGPASPGLRSEATREGGATEGPGARASGASANVADPA